MKSIYQIYSLVIESLVLENLKDDLIEKYGSSEEVKHLVDFYWNTARKRDNKDTKDINYWLKSDKTLEDFKAYLEPYLKKTGKISKDIKDAKEYYEHLTRNQMYDYTLVPKDILNQLNYDQIFNDGEWQIIVPKDQFASIFFGKMYNLENGSKWCTSKIYDNKFYDYSYNGPQYIIIDKKNKTKYNIQFSGTMDEGNKQNSGNTPIEDYSIFPEKILDIILELALKLNNNVLLVFINNIYNENIRNKYLEKYKKQIGSIALNKQLIAYVTHNDIDGVKQLIAHKTDIHVNYNEALAIAAINGHLEIVKFLVQNGADIHTRDEYPLRYASQNDHFEVVKYLIENGADVHADDDFPLRIAAEQGQLEIVKYLVEHGADIHAENDYAANWAATFNHFDVVKYLVENGADIYLIYKTISSYKYSSATRTKRYIEDIISKQKNKKI